MNKSEQTDIMFNVAPNDVGSTIDACYQLGYDIQTLEVIKQQSGCFNILMTHLV